MNYNTNSPPTDTERYVEMQIYSAIPEQDITQTTNTIDESEALYCSINSNLLTHATLEPTAYQELADAGAERTHQVREHNHTGAPLEAGYNTLSYRLKAQRIPRTLSHPRQEDRHARQAQDSRGTTEQTYRTFSHSLNTQPIPVQQWSATTNGRARAYTDDTYSRLEGTRRPFTARRSIIDESALAALYSTVDKSKKRKFKTTESSEEAGQEKSAENVEELYSKVDMSKKRAARRRKEKQKVLETSFCSSLSESMEKTNHLTTTAEKVSADIAVDPEISISHELPATPNPKIATDSEPPTNPRISETSVNPTTSMDPENSVNPKIPEKMEPTVSSSIVLDISIGPEASDLPTVPEKMEPEISNSTDPDVSMAATPELEITTDPEISNPEISNSINNPLEIHVEPEDLCETRTTRADQQSQRKIKQLTSSLENIR